MAEQEFGRAIIYGTILDRGNSVCLIKVQPNDLNDLFYANFVEKEEEGQEEPQYTARFPRVPTGNYNLIAKGHYSCKITVFEGETAEVDLR